MDGQHWKEHSVESDWEAAAFMGYPVPRAAGELLAAPFQVGNDLIASAGLQWLEIWMAAVTSSRAVIDSWRNGVRDQQNAFLSGLHDQLSRERAKLEATASARHVPADSSERETAHA